MIPGQSPARLRRSDACCSVIPRTVGTRVMLGGAASRREDWPAHAVQRKARASTQTGRIAVRIGRSGAELKRLDEVEQCVVDLDRTAAEDDRARHALGLDAGAPDAELLVVRSGRLVRDPVLAPDT